jgi:polyphenol oxidase
MILPQPGEPFEWRETPYGPALVCTPLDEVAMHLFTTRSWRLGDRRHSARAAWSDVAAAFGAEPTALVRLHQVHGRDAVVAEGLNAYSPDHLPQADIALTGDASIVVAVQAADCVPLLIADRHLGVVAAAHAGWRGLAQGVPGAVIAALTREFGSRPRDLVAAIGPSVGACCYEVGPEVREAFTRGGFDDGSIDRWFSEQPVILPGNPPMPNLHRRPGHWYFDGWSSARQQLRDGGVDDSRIFSAGLCTASHPSVLCSYRRDGAAAGRIAGAIRPLLR